MPSQEMHISVLLHAFVNDKKKEFFSKLIARDNAQVIGYVATGSKLAQKIEERIIPFSERPNNNNFNSDRTKSTIRKANTLCE